MGIVRKAFTILINNPAQIPYKLRGAFYKRVVSPVLRRTGTGYALPPITLGINLTYRCNLRCEQCLQKRDADHPDTKPYHDPKQEMTFEDWIKVLDQAKELRTPLYVTGGEPLISSYFEDFLRAAKDRGLRIHLQTNGMLLSKKLDVILETCVGHVSLSIDGTEEIHDEVRGVKGSYRRAIEGIEKLIAEKNARGLKEPYAEINTCILKSNMRELPQVAQLALDLGIDYFQLQHVIFSSAENEAKHDRVWSRLVEEHGLPSMYDPEQFVYEHGLTREEVQEVLIPNLKRVERMLHRKVPFGYFPTVPLDKLEAYYFDLDYPFPQRCSSPWTGMRIMPSGHFVSCFDLVIGNVKEQSLLSMWNSTHQKRFRSLITNRLLPGCARCCGRAFE